MGIFGHPVRGVSPTFDVLIMGSWRPGVSTTGVRHNSRVQVYDGSALQRRDIHVHRFLSHSQGAGRPGIVGHGDRMLHTILDLRMTSTFSHYRAKRQERDVPDVGGLQSCLSSERFNPGLPLRNPDDVIGYHLVLGMALTLQMLPMSRRSKLSSLGPR